jgi:hypothetical protein
MDLMWIEMASLSDGTAELTALYEHEIEIGNSRLHHLHHLHHLS